MTIHLEPGCALDAAKMAVMFAIRRDWAPFPTTQAWHPETQLVLATVAQELYAEARALLRAAEQV